MDARGGLETQGMVWSRMTRNGRIILNVAATYGRSLYALLVGLYTSRWALQALGEVDFGLAGVVGGLVGFIAFFNNMLASVVGRFYAVSVGKASVAEDGAAALEETRAWFSTAVAIHTVVPTLLMLAGYPAGMWAVRNFLTIPPDRLADCEWVFRFVCFSSYLTMVSVPVQAMYTAKQYIAELTVYSFATTTLKAVGLWYMVRHEGPWLWQYGLMLCLLTVTPQLLIALRGFHLFPECRFRWKRALEGRRVREIAYFAGWLLVGSLGVLVRVQGVQVLINKFFGPAVNAAMTVASTVNANTLMLAGAMVGAFQPAIVQAYGAKDRERMLGLSYRACKFASLFLLVFMLPLSLEVDEVLRLWLVNPPAYAGGLCLLTFAVTFLDMCTVGHRLVLMARGKMALFQLTVGLTEVLVLPCALAMCWLGSGVYGVNGSVLGVMAVAVWIRVLFARQLTGMSIGHWLWKVMVPVGLAAAVGFGTGWCVRFRLPTSPLRVVATTAVCNGVFLGLAWGVVLDRKEKEYWIGRLAQTFQKWRKREV